MRAPHPGLIAALGLAALIGAALAGLARAGGGGGALPWAYLAATIQGAALQAALSTALALLIGTALALALIRRPRFPGRSLLTALVSAATVAPTIVIVFGVLAVYGRSGWLAQAGLPPASIFGLQGVVLAHVIMNAPFVARIMLHGFAAEPAEHARMAAMLRFSATDCFRHLDWPVIRREWPGAAAIVFLLCFTSFAVVLMLGGGPRNATLEVAIYEALRIEADFARAAMIAGVQIACCLSFVALIGLTGVRLPETAGLRAARPRPDAASPAVRAFDAAALAFAALLVAPVLLSVLDGWRQLPALAGLGVGAALATSLALGAASAVLSVGLGLLLASAAERTTRGRRSARRARAYDLGVLALIGLPPFALAAGLFIWLRGVGPLGTIGLVLVPLINALMALPFVYRLLAPAFQRGAERYGRLSESLGLSGVGRLRIVLWPLLRGPLAGAFAFAMALSVGDLGVITLFAGRDLQTLPSLMSQLLGAYRFGEASAVALLLVMVAGGLALLAEHAADIDRARLEARPADA
jgi:thiamine transport system permease protein